jgi:hypothetical protein
MQHAFIVRVTQIEQLGRRWFCHPRRAMTTRTIPNYVLANMSISALKTSFIVSLVFFIGMATSLHAQTTADPYRREEGRTWRNALESTMGSDHREGLAAGNAFLAGPTGCPAILPAIL